MLLFLGCSWPPDGAETVFTRHSNSDSTKAYPQRLWVKVYPAQQRVLLNVHILTPDGAFEHLEALPQAANDNFEGGKYSSSCLVYSRARWVCSTFGFQPRTDYVYSSTFMARNDTVTETLKIGNASGEMRAKEDTVTYVKMPRFRRAQLWVERLISNL